MGPAIHSVRLGIANCFLLVSPEGRAVLIDTGQPGKEATLDRALSRLGVAPEQIELVVLTHGHWDHVGCARHIRQRSGAPLAMHVLDRHALELGLPTAPPGITRWGKVFGGLLRGLQPFNRFPPVGVDLPLGSDGLDLGQYGVPGRVIFTPGHTAGSVSVVLESGDAFVGDMAMNGLPLRRGPGLPIFAEAPRSLRPSWQRLLEQDIRTVYPAHGKPFLARVLRDALARGAD